jgi:hypothetical protein
VIAPPRNVRKPAPSSWRRLRTVTPVQLFVASFLGWLQHEQKEIILYLREENRVVEAQLRHQRLRLTDHDRRRLAALGERLGRRMLAQVAMIVTPDTMAPAAHRPEMDVLETASRTAQCAPGDPPPRRADGD